MSLKYIIGIDLGGTHLRLDSFNFTTLKPTKNKSLVKVPISNNRTDAQILKLIQQQIEGIIQEHKGVYPVAIGCGIPGLVNPSKGTVYTSPHFPQWTNFHFQKKLETKLKVPVVIDNDVPMIARGEQQRGAAKSWDTFLLITLGTGIGGALVIDNQIFHGSEGYAGEFGHMCLDPQGAPCNCGSRGCFETLVSLSALKKRVAQAIANKSLSASWKKIPDSELGFCLATQAAHNPVIKKIFNHMAFFMGVGLANLVNITGIHHILIGGGLGGDLLINPAQKILKSYLYAHTAKKISIRQTKLGDHAGTLGAALLAKQKVSF